MNPSSRRKIIELYDSEEEKEERENEEKERKEKEKEERERKEKNLFRIDGKEDRHYIESYKWPENDVIEKNEIEVY
jgi:hypothetical protein